MMTIIPTNLQPLIDADVIRYEIGFAAETGWKAITQTEDLPPWDYVERLLFDRIERIKEACNTALDPKLYLTSGRTFRYDIAKTKPYKGQRKENKPWHFNNLTVYLTDVLGAEVVTGIEADDAIAIQHSNSDGTTIVCSRDKDLKQVPGWFYSWELGRQPSWGPDLITQQGELKLSQDRQKLTGSGLAWFYAQVLTGDTADNIPGLPKCGPVKVHMFLNGKDSQAQLDIVCDAYADYYGDDWKEKLTEQGQLCWLLRKPDQVWQIGMVE